MENTLKLFDRRKLLTIFFKRWALIFLIIEIIIFSIVATGFLSVNGLQIILFFNTAIFLLGVGELFVIITGGIDLSVGFLMGFASIVSAKLIVVFVNIGFSPGLAILFGIVLTLIIGLIPGLVNGLLVAKVRVPSFIATFAMLGITHGISELLIEGVPAKNLPQLANNIGNGYFIYIMPSKNIISFFVKPEITERGTLLIELIPNIVIITFIVVAIFSFILKRTRFGQHVYAIGGNEDAAVRSGINVSAHLIAVYMISSFFATLAGVFYTLTYVTGKADAGAAFLMDAISAVVIGGASLFGGVGTVWKTILGCFILAVLETGLRMLGIQNFDKYILVGLILIVAILIDQLAPVNS